MTMEKRTQKKEKLITRQKEDRDKEGEKKETDGGKVEKIRKD